MFLLKLLFTFVAPLFVLGFLWSKIRAKRMATRNQKYWEGKTAIVTGASSGIGLEIACQLASFGCNLVIAARSLDTLNHVIAQELTPRFAKRANNSGRAIAVRTDLSDLNDARNLVRAAIDSFGRLDAIIMNAAATMYRYFEDYQDPVRGATEIMNTNYLANVAMISEALPYLRRNSPQRTHTKEPGLLLYVSSLGGKVGIPFTSFYGASKAASNIFLDSLRTEIGPDLRIGNALVGFVATDIAIFSQGESHRKEAMPVDVCARKILETGSCGFEDRTLPMIGKVMLPLGFLFPGFLRSQIKKHVATREEQLKHGDHPKHVVC